MKLPFLHEPLAPLPGTERPKRGLFIDRWGSLLELPSGGFSGHFHDARFTPRALQALFRARTAGWELYLIGNEEAVATGRISDDTWQRFETSMLEHMADHGAPLKRTYACLDDPLHGKGKHRRDSVFQLPGTGAMYHAMQHDGVALEECWVVGDSSLELAAGWRAGCRTAGLRTGLALGDGALQVEPHLIADDLASFVYEVLAMTPSARA
jgi:D-glycero-D-manno-heptose 1,7-bisphosphate phosphatase